MGWTVALKMLPGEIWFCFWFRVSLLSGEYIYIYNIYIYNTNIWVNYNDLTATTGNHS